MLFVSSIKPSLIIACVALLPSLIIISGCSLLGPQDSEKSKATGTEFPVYTSSAPTAATATPFSSPLISAVNTKVPETQTSPTPTLESGELLTTSYQVKSGDTLSGIAERFNLTIADIRRLNPEQTDDNIFVGQILTIESSNAPTANTQVPASPTATSVPASPTAVASQTTILYLVEPGDAAILIAETFGITFDELQNLNPGVDLATIFIGQALNVPK